MRILRFMQRLAGVCCLSELRPETPLQVEAEIHLFRNLHMEVSRNTLETPRKKGSIGTRWVNCAGFLLRSTIQEGLRAFLKRPFPFPS